MRQQALATLFATVLTAAVSAGPGHAAIIKSLTIDNALPSSVASQAGVDYALAPGEEFVVRVIVSYLPGGSAQTLHLASTAPHLVSSKQLPPSGPGGDVSYQANYTLADTEDETRFRLAAEVPGATSRSIDVIVAPSPPSAAFTIARPGDGEAIRPFNDVQTRVSTTFFWRVGMSVANEVPRASHAEWCWRSLAQNSGSLQNWSCAKTSPGRFGISRSFQFENNNGNLSGTAFPGTNQVKVRPCNVRGCGTDSPVREFNLTTSSLGTRD